MIEVEYLGPPIARATLDAAWRRIVEGLRDIANSPEVLRAAGAWQFVLQLEEACEDIGAHLTSDSFPDAWGKLVAGIARSHKAAQDAPRAASARAAWDAWAAELKKPKAERRTKKAFKLDLQQRYGISDSTAVRWLRERT